MKQRLYKPNQRLYCLLLAGSLAFLVFSVLLPYSSKWFTVLSGIGCGGIASVAVAWMIDIANCKHKEAINEDFLQQLFFDYDALIKHELSITLKWCAERNAGIDIDKKYDIQEIQEIIDKADENSPFWASRYENLGAAHSSVNNSLLLVGDLTKDHTSLFSLMTTCERNFSSFKYSVKYADENDNINRLAYIMFKTHLSFLDDIYRIRSTHVEVNLSDEDKRYVQKFREAVDKQKTSCKGLNHGIAET